MSFLCFFHKYTSFEQYSKPFVYIELTSKFSSWMMGLLLLLLRCFVVPSETDVRRWTLLSYSEHGCAQAWVLNPPKPETLRENSHQRIQSEDPDRLDGLVGGEDRLLRPCWHFLFPHIKILPRQKESTKTTEWLQRCSKDRGNMATNQRNHGISDSFRSAVLK